MVSRFARAHPLPFTISIFGALLYSFATVLMPAILGWITDEAVVPALDDGDPNIEKWAIAAALIGVSVMRSAGVVCRRFFAGVTQARIKASARNDLVDHYLGLPLQFHRDTPTGTLLAHADADTEMASMAMAPLPFTIGVLGLLFFAAVSLVMVDWVLALAAFVFVPFVAVANHYNSHFLEKPAATVQHEIAGVAAVASESFDGAMVVKALGREKEEAARFAVRAEQLREARVKVAIIRAIYHSAIAALPDLGVIGMVALGAWRVNEGAISVGNLVQVVTLFGVLSLPLLVIGFFFGDLPQAVVANERIELVLAEKLEHRQTEADPGPGALFLVAHDLSLARGEAELIDGVSFEVKPGETIALVGPTGSGKSTLLEVLAGILPPDGGDLWVGGVAAHDQAAPGFGGRVALALQEPFLFKSTISENIGMSRPCTDADIHTAARRAAADEFIGEMSEGYDTVVGERGVTLSGGQRQRVALARALAGEPGLLLLDDALSAVDPRVEARILAAIGAVGSTVVTVAQRRSTIDIADRVLYLDGGRIVAQGPHERLMETEPGYAALVEAYARDEATT
jgi:ATP-binding cassette subfamily B protein